MQIGSATTIPFIPVTFGQGQGSLTSSASGSDRAVLNLSADTFSSLVSEAKAMPEVRSEVVDSFKARIHSGHYPSQDVVAGLTRLMGGVVGQALSDSSK